MNKEEALAWLEYQALEMAREIPGSVPIAVEIEPYDEGLGYLIVVITSASSILAAGIDDVQMTDDDLSELGETVARCTARACSAVAVTDSNAHLTYITNPRGIH